MNNNPPGTMRVASVMEKSAAVMSAMNELVKVPEIQATMRELAHEMAKAGLIEETIDDAMGMLDEDGIEEAADAEVDAVLFELTKGVMGHAPAAGSGALATGAQAEPDLAEEEEADAMISRLQALRAS
jgi:charged multivesicular body protein 3